MSHPAYNGPKGWDDYIYDTNDWLLRAGHKIMTAADSKIINYCYNAAYNPAAAARAVRVDREQRD